MMQKGDLWLFSFLLSGSERLLRMERGPWPTFKKPHAALAGRKAKWQKQLPR